MHWVVLYKPVIFQHGIGGYFFKKFLIFEKVQGQILTIFLQELKNCIQVQKLFPYTWMISFGRFDHYVFK